MCKELAKGDELLLKVESLNNLGCGVCRAPDGRAVFAAGGVTGDTVKLELIKLNKSFAVGRITEVVAASPNRVEHFCAAPASCGGCVYRLLSYGKELLEKRENVVHAFRKAGLSPHVEEVQTAGGDSRYRNKAEFPIAESAKGLYSGFYAQKTHSVIRCADCALTPAVFSEILAFFLSFFNGKAHAYKEETGKGQLRHLYLRLAPGTGEIMVCPVINGESLPYEKEFTAELLQKFPTVTSVQLNVNRENTNLVLGKQYRLLYGKEYIEDILCGKKFRVAPASFYQVNHDATELLYALAAARAGKGELLLDLYCGAGTVGLSMGRNFKRIIGVEIVPDAVKAAECNAKANEMHNAAFYCGDADDTAQFLNSAEETEGRICPDVVVLDPPRKGCDEKLLQFLCDRQMKKIVYISCNPDTLARDAAFLVSKGYTLGSVTPVNLFPRTGHVESVVLLSRAGEDVC